MLKPLFYKHYLQSLDLDGMDPGMKTQFSEITGIYIKIKEMKTNITCKLKNILCCQYRSSTCIFIRSIPLTSIPFEYIGWRNTQTYFCTGYSAFVIQCVCLHFISLLIFT